MELRKLSNERVLHLFKQQQDHATFSELVNRHRSYIVKHCYRYLMRHPRCLTEQLL